MLNQSKSESCLGSLELGPDPNPAVLPPRFYAPQFVFRARLDAILSFHTPYSSDRIYIVTRSRRTNGISNERAASTEFSLIGNRSDVPRF